jgi:hypothetical protein
MPAIGRPGRCRTVLNCNPDLSAWESVPSGPVTWPDLRSGLSASDRERPLITGVNGPLMARVTITSGATFRFSGYIPSWLRSYECCALSPVAAVRRWLLLLLSPCCQPRVCVAALEQKFVGGL